MKKTVTWTDLSQLGINETGYCNILMCKVTNLVTLKVYPKVTYMSNS